MLPDMTSRLPSDSVRNNVKTLKIGPRFYEFNRLILPFSCFALCAVFFPLLPFGFWWYFEFDCVKAHFSYALLQPGIQFSIFTQSEDENERQCQSKFKHTHN